jgi:hypothetical protein
MDRAQNSSPQECQELHGFHIGFTAKTILLYFHRADGHPLVIAVRCFRPLARQDTERNSN